MVLFGGLSSILDQEVARMRKEYGSTARRLFLECARQALPEFTARDDLNKVLLPGERVLSRNMTAICAFVVFVPDRANLNSFTIECGWSTQMAFPAFIPRPTGILDPSAIDCLKSEFVFRLANLFGKSDFWWVIEPYDGSYGYILNGPRPVSAEESRTRIKPLMNDCFGKLTEWAVPFFDKLDSHFADMKKLECHSDSLTAVLKDTES